MSRSSILEGLSTNVLHRVENKSSKGKHLYKLCINLGTIKTQNKTTELNIMEILYKSRFLDCDVSPTSYCDYPITAIYFDGKNIIDTFTESEFEEILEIYNDRLINEA